MALVGDMAVSALLIATAAIINRVGLMLMGEGTMIHHYATEAAIGGADLADQWATVVGLWIPSLIIFCGIAWPFVRAYRRQSVSRRVR